MTALKKTIVVMLCAVEVFLLKDTLFAGIDNCEIKASVINAPSPYKIDLSSCKLPVKNIDLEVIDAMGNPTRTKLPVNDSAGPFIFSINANNKLMPGIYIVKAAHKNPK